MLMIILAVTILQSGNCWIGRSRLLPGKPCSSEAHQQNLTYLIFTFQVLQASIYLVYYSRKVEPRAERTNFILRPSLTSRR